MGKKTILSLGILGFLLICFFCIYWHAGKIESDLLARSSSALSDAGIAGADLSFSGRDARLIGSTDSGDDLQKAADVVAGVRGVRAVTTQLVISEDAPALSSFGLPQSTPIDLKNLLANSIISFGPNSARLSAAGADVLRQLAPRLKQSDMMVEIAGHTDSQGDDRLNLALSQKRADVVMTYLLENGVPGRSLRAVGYGASQPLAENSTEAGRQMNRRVEFKVK